MRPEHFGAIYHGCVNAAQLRHDKTKGRRDERIPLHPVVVEHLRRITDYGVLVFDWPFGLTALYDEFYRIQKLAGIDVPCREDHKHTDACHHPVKVGPA